MSRLFGYWPSFHDAEVVSIHCDRMGQNDYPGPTLDAKIHVFEMTKEVDARGYYVLRHHTLVTLRFFQIASFKAEGFNIQNVLWGLRIIDITDRQMEDVKVEVEFPTSWGLEMTFVCTAVAVVAAEPFNPVAR